MKQALILFLMLLVIPQAFSTECGKERWPVKTLADSDAQEINFQPMSITIAELIGASVPDRATLQHAMAERVPAMVMSHGKPVVIEKQVWQITALLIGYKKETDSDYHIVLADLHNKKQTLIIEMPSPDCAPKRYQQNFTKNRVVFDKLAKGWKQKKGLRRPPSELFVTVQGVGFIDFIHGQTGVAPNGVELHPVLSLVDMVVEHDSGAAEGYHTAKVVNAKHQVAQ